MELIEQLFSSDNELVNKLKENAVKLDYKNVFFDHLGPELNKLFEKNKNKVSIKNFLDASQYEYGFFNKEIDLQKAFSLYKKYADEYDYLCMYKMHIIYLCEYDKFNVGFNRILEKIYLFKCFAYLPNYVYDWRLKLFEKIDVLLEIAKMLDLEDMNLDKHKLFFDLLIAYKDNYNLSENDVNLMKGTFYCYFNKQVEDDLNILSFSILSSIMPQGESDFAYYNARNKCVYFRESMNLKTIISDTEIEKFYKEIEDKKLYQFYGDYGNYLLDKKDKANPEIIKILATASNEGDLFGSFRAYQASIDYYDLDDVLEDFDKASNILDFLLDEIVFEKLMFSQFILLVGLLIKYSKFPEKIEEKYFPYVKEINDYINSILEKEETIKEKLEHYYIIKSYIYYFGFKDIEERNLQKSLELQDKALSITNEIYAKRRNHIFRYNIIKILHEKKLKSDEELNKEKKNMIQFYYDNINLKYELIDCYVLGKDFYEGITRKKDEFITISIYKSAQNLFCKAIIDWKVQSEIKKFIKENENKIPKRNTDDICCVCYENKVSKLFIPCGHFFCSFCTGIIEKDKKCPFCRTEVMYII